MMTRPRISRKYMEFKDRLQVQQIERRSILAFNKFMDRASGVS